MTDRPHVICEHCYQLQADVFISGTWLYCSHYKAMARRRNRTDQWTIDRNVSEKKAQKHVNAAMAGMAKWCEKEGTTLEKEFVGIQRLFKQGRLP
jgi:hypothetical protein